MPGGVYTLGYAAPGAMQRLEYLMADPMMLLVDVRLVPRSRWYPQWNKVALVRRWGLRYTHQHCFGNINYRDRDKPIVLRGPHVQVEQSFAWAVSLLCAGYSLVLLCVCRDEQRCHRLMIANRLVELMNGGGEGDGALGGVG
jgi:uncharacterized protein (DUF488 family)